MTESLAALLAAHAGGKALRATIDETYDRVERHNDPALFIALRPRAEALAIAGRLQAGRTGRQAPVRRSVRRQGQYRRRRLADHGRLSCFRLRAAEIGIRRRAARARGRDRRRQDEPRSVRDRPCRRALALRGPAERFAAGPHSGRIELGFSDRGRRGTRSLFARDRHRRLRTGAGGAQRHRRAETLARRALGRGARARMPDARHDLNFRPRRRRRVCRVRGGVRL